MRFQTLITQQNLKNLGNHNNVLYLVFFFTVVTYAVVFPINESEISIIIRLGNSKKSPQEI